MGLMWKIETRFVAWFYAIHWLLVMKRALKATIHEATFENIVEVTLSLWNCGCGISDYLEDHFLSSEDHFSSAQGIQILKFQYSCNGQIDDHQAEKVYRIQLQC